ncbi:ABC transporter substrate-binding protein [Ensifer sp. SSB1]|jgi:putative spermidine/putrescine transport system substrate-binding protein|uniref:ABC transporter substrate-binding protein n=1 Tax=Ensifer sp. SSB1 TaxID=2795385 RepID=UPI001A4B84C0|nr:ABC transporter substrate-binding protein [Ensifer sp. SSB1]MBK5571324.1 ABC transporter substrate-binding protein [Ensifer sp. SSB1]
MLDFLRLDNADILETKYKNGEIDRRQLLKALGILGLASTAMGRIAFAQQKDLVLATWGGDTSKAIDSVFGAAFTKATNINVKDDGSGPTEGAVQAQATSGKISWDVLQLDYFSSVTLGKKGLLGPIDYNVVKKSRVLENSSHEFGVACFLNSYVLAYDTSTYGDNPPKTWADFFDVEKFPGKRTFPKWMIGVPEAALLADGVPPDQLYPLDLDRAFKKIKALMPHVAAVWGSGSESQQIMLSGEASMGLLLGTRAILVDRDTDQKITFSFNDGLLIFDAWSYSKGNPAGAEAANQFIAATQDPALQVEMLKLVGFGPINPEAAKIVPEELRRIDCSQPEHLSVMHRVSMEWYADNYAAALDKYTAVISS